YTPPASQTDTPPAADLPAADLEAQGDAGEGAWDVLRGGGSADADLLPGTLTLDPAVTGFLPKLPLVPKQLADSTTNAVKGQNNTTTTTTPPPSAAELQKLANLPKQKQLDYLQDLQTKNPAKFDALVQALSAGAVKDRSIALP